MRELTPLCRESETFFSGGSRRLNLPLLLALDYFVISDVIRNRNTVIEKANRTLRRGHERRRLFYYCRANGKHLARRGIRSMIENVRAVL